jgi:DNA-binding IclR family transcriptional regulator
MEMARPLGWTKTSAYRYLATLAALGYLEIDEASRRYRPTVKVLSLGYAALNALGFPELSLPFLEQLSQRFGESTGMAVLDGTEVVCGAPAVRTRFQPTKVHVGSRLPAPSWEQPLSPSVSMRNDLSPHSGWRAGRSRAFSSAKTELEGRRSRGRR